MKTALLTAAALAFTATAASAETWTGCRIGAGGTITASVTDASGGQTPGPGISGSVDGFGTQAGAITGLVGCDYQTGAFIVGAFADYSFGENEFTAKLAAPGFAADLKTGFENVWSVGARAGYAVTPTTALFLLGGISGAKGNDIVATLNGTEVGRFKLDDPRGWFVGGQVETHLTPRLVFTAGYKFTRFDKETIDLAPLPAAINLETDTHAVTATISFKFGAADTALTPTK